MLKNIMKKIYNILFYLILIQGLFTQSINNYIFLNNQLKCNEYIYLENIKNDQLELAYISPNYSSVLNNDIISDYYYYNQNNQLHSYYRLEIQFNNFNNQIRKIINGSIVLEPMPRVVFQNDFEFDSNGYFDLNYKGRLSQIGGDWTGYLQHSSLTYFNDWGHILIGKTNLAFSNTNSSLLLNSFFPPSETIWWHFNRDKLGLDGAIIFLDSLELKNRIISFGRYSYNSHYLHIGFSELVIFSYDNLSSQELNYLLPASILFESEINNGKNANLFWMLDIQAKIKNKTFIFELLIDDISLDKLSPHKIGTRISLLNYYNQILYGFEYVRINRWVGNYFDKDKRMVENNVLIGHQLGPDSHLIKFILRFNLNESLFISNNLSFVEKGNSDINDWPDNIEASENFGFNSEIFPSRPITKNIENILEINKFFFYKKIKINFTKKILLSTLNIPEFKFEVNFAI